MKVRDENEQSVAWTLGACALVAGAVFLLTWAALAWWVR